LPQLGFRADHVVVGHIHLRGDRAQLPVERGDEAGSGIRSAVEVAHLFVEIVRVGLQLAHLPLEVSALLTDAFELGALLPDFVLTADRGHGT